MQQRMNDPLQSLLWCADTIIRSRRIKKPKYPMGLAMMELGALMEIREILDQIKQKGETKNGH
jgi:hypothetical protein